MPPQVGMKQVTASDINKKRAIMKTGGDRVLSSKLSLTEVALEGAALVFVCYQHSLSSCNRESFTHGSMHGGLDALGGSRRGCNQ